MLEQLVNLVRENASEAIVKNPAIPDQQNDAAINATANGILESLKGQFTAGNASALTNMLASNDLSSNPMIGKISEQVGNQLASKFGISNSAAGSIAASLIPTVMNQFAKKTNDPNDSSFTMDGIMNSLSAKNSIYDKVKDVFGPNS